MTNKNKWVYRIILLSGLVPLALFYRTGENIYAPLACVMVLAGAVYYFLKCTDRTQNDKRILIKNSVFVGIMLVLFFVIHY
jgi:hypothetical protein